MRLKGRRRSPTKMEPKRILISFLSAVVVFIAFMIILGVTSDRGTDQLLGAIMEDVFTHAHPASQDQVYEKIILTCDNVGRYESSDDYESEVNELCNNEEKLQEMDDFCKRFATMNPQQKEMLGEENIESAEEACAGFSIKKVREECKKSEEISGDTINAVIHYCDDLDRKGWTRAEAFSNFIMYSMEGDSNPEQQENIERLEQLSSMTELNNTSMIVGSIIIGLFIVLIVLLLIHEPPELFRRLSNILINIGILLLLPLVIVYIYVKFVGIDTTVILNAVSQTGQAADQMGSVVGSIVPLVLQRMYPIATGIIGAISLVIGILGRITSMTLRHAQEMKGIPQQPQQPQPPTGM